MAPASPRIRLILELSWKVLDSPFFRSPSKSIRPLWSLAEIQLRPLTALTWTVTLSWGAAAIALSEGPGVLSGLLSFGVGEIGLLVDGTGPSATDCLASSPPPLKAVK